MANAVVLFRSVLIGRIGLDDRDTAGGGLRLDPDQFGEETRRGANYYSCT